MKHITVLPAVPAPMRQQFASLEWLRFILALYIAVFHTLHYGDTPGWIRGIFDMGFFATSTFFILSGFLLAHVYLSNPGTDQAAMREPARSFITKRFANLYPIHLGSMALIILVGLFIMVAPVGQGDAAWSFFNVSLDRNDWAPSEAVRYELSGAELAGSIVLNLSLLHAWNPFFLSLNIPSWSISALMFFYLLFPWLAPRLHRIKYPLLGLVVCNALFLVPTVGAIASDQFGVPITGVLHRNPVIRITEFAAGILLCALYHRRAQQGKGSGWPWLMLLMAILAVSITLARQFLSMGASVSDKGGVPYFLLHNGLLMPAQLCLLMLCVHINNRWVPLKSLSKRLGGCSLSIFALHVPLYMIFARVDRVIAGDPSLCLTSVVACARAAGDKALLNYPLFVVLLVAVSLLFQRHFVERLRDMIESRLIARPKASAVNVIDVPSEVVGVK